MKSSLTCLIKMCINLEFACLKESPVEVILQLQRSNKNKKNIYSKLKLQ